MDIEDFSRAIVELIREIDQDAYYDHGLDRITAFGYQFVVEQSRMKEPSEHRIESGKTFRQNKRGEYNFPAAVQYIMSLLPNKRKAREKIERSKQYCEISDRLAIRYTDTPIELLHSERGVRVSLVVTTEEAAIAAAEALIASIEPGQ